MSGNTDNSEHNDNNPPCDSVGEHIVDSHSGGEPDSNIPNDARTARTATSGTIPQVDSDGEEDEQEQQQQHQQQHIDNLSEHLFSLQQLIDAGAGISQSDDDAAASQNTDSDSSSESDDVEVVVFEPVDSSDNDDDDGDDDDGDGDGDGDNKHRESRSELRARIESEMTDCTPHPLIRPTFTPVCGGIRTGTLPSTMNMNIASALYRRQYGKMDHNRVFSQHEAFVSRLSLDAVLEGHMGCVNTVRWNSTGTRLVSGSDDTKLKIWDPCSHKLLVSWDSGHMGNIFNAHFVPFTQDHQVVSCAADGQLRHWDHVKQTHKVWHCHEGMTHKIGIHASDPSVFLSCSEDGTVRQIDLRQRHRCQSDCANVLVRLFDRSEGRIIGINSLSLNPQQPEYFAIAARDTPVRIFDRRYLSPQANNSLADPVALLNPVVGADSTVTPPEGATGVAFSQNGQEVVATYSAHQIYMFDTSYLSTCASRQLSIPQSAESDRDHDAKDDGASASVDDHTSSLVASADESTPTARLFRAYQRIRARHRQQERHEQRARYVGNGTKSCFVCRCVVLFTMLTHVLDSTACLRLCQYFVFCFFFVFCFCVVCRMAHYSSLPLETGDRADDSKQTSGDISSRALHEIEHHFDAETADSDSNENELEEEDVANQSASSRRQRHRSLTGWKFSWWRAQERQERRLLHELHRSTHDSGSGPAQTFETEKRDALRRVWGHRNVRTVKEVNFFGPNSEFIVSGSDCGRVFMWRKSDGRIVQVLNDADEDVVNVVQGSPDNCRLATSGIENDIKLWTPISAERTLQVDDVLADVLGTNREESERPQRVMYLPSRLLAMLMAQLNGD
jgi:WD and tetratricopeptide repeats protein 1